MVERMIGMGAAKFADDTIPTGMFERAMKALMDADPDQAMFERTDRGSLRYNLAAAQVRAVITAMREPIISALKPFADCAEELDGSQDTPRAPDGEWAKFRLLTDDYRRARDVVTMIDVALENAPES